ncbi:MAG: hypothetical protein AAGA85_19200 [Bacteroidota bacterium]
MTWLTALILTCGTVTFPAPLQKESSQVIIFRGGSYILQRFELWVNDEPVLQPFKQNTAITLTLPEGDVKVALSRGSSWGLHGSREYVIQVEAGRTYYLQAELEYDFPVTYLGLTVSNSQRYLKMLPKLSQVE